MRLALRVALALSGFGIAGAAFAEGNALNPAGVNPASAGRWMDEEGLGTRIPAARTPTGQLYNIPPQADEPELKKDAWNVSGFVEGGAMHVYGDAKSPGFLQYKDL